MVLDFRPDLYLDRMAGTVKYPQHPFDGIAIEVAAHDGGEARLSHADAFGRLSLGQLLAPHGSDNSWRGAEDAHSIGLR